MSKIKGKVLIDRDRCKGCELCVVACPVHILALADQVNARGYHFSMVQQPESCIGCASCALVCPDSCITVYRQKVEA